MRPFGHSGEEMLAECMRDHGGFDHNRQSVRVVELLETPYPDFPGLNLTFEVREGLRKHERPYKFPLRQEKNTIVHRWRARLPIWRMRSRITVTTSMTRLILKS
jgi:dGTP triphosphohydrolase